MNLYYFSSKLILKNFYHLGLSWVYEMNLNNIAAMCTSVPLMLIMHKAQRLFHQSVMSVTPSPLIKIEYLMIKTITYLGSYHSKRKLKFAFQIFQLPARE